MSIQTTGLAAIGPRTYLVGQALNGLLPQLVEGCRFPISNQWIAQVAASAVELADACLDRMTSQGKEREP